MVGIIPPRREIFSCVATWDYNTGSTLSFCMQWMSECKFRSSHYVKFENLLFEPLSILYWPNTLRLYLLYAGMGSNKHAESSYLKKKQEDKKEMRKYKVSSVVRENL